MYNRMDDFTSHSLISCVWGDVSPAGHPSPPPTPALSRYLLLFLACIDVKERLRGIQKEKGWVMVLFFPACPCRSEVRRLLKVMCRLLVGRHSTRLALSPLMLTDISMCCLSLLPLRHREIAKARSRNVPFVFFFFHDSYLISFLSVFALNFFISISRTFFCLSLFLFNSVGAHETNSVSTHARTSFSISLLCFLFFLCVTNSF